MFESVRFIEIVLLIYGLSLIGYFWDFIQQNQKVNRMAFWLLGLVWVIQTMYLLDSIFITRNFPISNLREGLFFYSWVLVTFSLIVNRFFKVHFIILFTNIFSFIILVLYIFTHAEKQSAGMQIQLANEILTIHIAISMVSYGFFTIGFLLSMMHLIQYYFLKKKIGLKWMWRFGDLQQLDQLSFWAITIGVPLLTIGLILGFVWAFASGAEFYWFDLKTIGSLVVLGVYMFYLFLRLGLHYQGKAISYYHTIAFLMLLINFFLFGVLSEFHF
ncbi:Protein HemX [Lentibacillus sp. JNUCC-1]|uniref:cytochrome C assembly family protein n=1 Tax=Lentibacillus sp. JNUCC-1 TaxID=2654513 RepID=UPI0012E9217C|nr:cytochrome c biogenesis protein CcsA [Lentibacillus sp. JNUCC-1]MUV39414.1 Protein HemX [Lentibacillus sp. JNUCC-1]